jgi:hypothetical protein
MCASSDGVPPDWNFPAADLTGLPHRFDWCRRRVTAVGSKNVTAPKMCQHFPSSACCQIVSPPDRISCRRLPRQKSCAPISSARTHRSQDGIKNQWSSKIWGKFEDAGLRRHPTRPHLFTSVAAPLLLDASVTNGTEERPPPNHRSPPPSRTTETAAPAGHGGGKTGPGVRNF